jgi:hypothetical protein
MRWSNLRNMVWSCAPPPFSLLISNVDDIQRVLSQDGYLRKLAKRVQSQVPSKRDGAIIALVALGNTTQGAGRRGVVFVGQKLNVNVSEVSCYGGHQDSENNTCPCNSAQPEIDRSFCCISAGASREDW